MIKPKKKQQDSWDGVKNAIEEKSRPYYINENDNTELNLGNYEFKLFNTKQAFYPVYEVYCKKNCCDENVNSIVATARNKLSSKTYYLSGDIQLYPLPLPRDQYPLSKWVNDAKLYYKYKKGIEIDHFNVYKASHHGIINYKGKGENNNLDILKAVRPDLCIVTTAAGQNGWVHIKGESNKRYNMADLIEDAKKEGIRFETKITGEVGHIIEYY